MAMTFGTWIASDDSGYEIKKFEPQEIDGKLHEKYKVSINDGNNLDLLKIQPKGEAWNGSTIIWGHWLGPHKSNSEQYLQEALDMAQKGFASVLFDAPWADPDWYVKRNLETESESFRKIFRSFHVLCKFIEQMQKSGSGHLFYIGHDYSAMFALPVLTLFKGFRSAVLIAFTNSFYDWAFYTQIPKDWQRYYLENDIYDLQPFFDEIDTPLFLQFAEGDVYVNEFRRGAIIKKFDKSGFASRVYGGLGENPHEMNSDEVRADRQRWLELFQSDQKNDQIVKDFYARMY